MAVITGLKARDRRLLHIQLAGKGRLRQPLIRAVSDQAERDSTSKRGALPLLAKRGILKRARTHPVIRRKVSGSHGPPPSIAASRSTAARRALRNPRTFTRLGALAGAAVRKSTTLKLRHDYGRTDLLSSKGRLESGRAVTDLKEAEIRARVL
jgi:hypothetical protein